MLLQGPIYTYWEFEDHQNINEKILIVFQGQQEITEWKVKLRSQAKSS